MSIIQTIRDRGAAIVIVVIALSLIGFLLMDARSGAAKGLFGGGNQTVIGSINGKEIEVDEFNAKVKAAEQQYPNNGPARQQIMQSVWDQMVGERIVTDQFDKLGLAFTAKEMSSIMFSDEAPQQLKQAFSDPQTGQYDIVKAQQWWTQTKKSKNEEQRDAINSQVIDPMRLNTLYTKYTSMISGSIYIPAWLMNKDMEEEKAFANISYVALPYSDISDSLVKVTDDDIEDYVEKNKLRYKQEAGRIISYVTFSAAPSAKDTLQTKEAVNSLKSNFAADTNAKAFVARNISAVNFSDAYVQKNKIQIPEKDSIINLADGDVFGPYLDGANYVLAKKVSTKILPDSIKCRHILLGTNNPQTGEAIMADSVAKQKIDSIETAIKGGAAFNTLEAIYSTDQVAHKDNGVMTFDLSAIQGENFAKEFADFLLNENGETKKAVKTQFGWHYIEILEKKNSQPAFKIAYMAKEIIPSDETLNAANTASAKLAGQARDEKAFDKYVTQNGLKKITLPNAVKENDYQLGALQDARSIVKWAWEAKEGEVSEPFTLKDEFVVAVVSHKVKEGLPDAKTARPLIESMVRNKKKAEEIIKKMGKQSTLEGAAAVFNKQVLNTGTDSTLTFNALIINGIGNEPKIAGASFNKEYQTKISPPISGNTGVFVIKVDKINMKPADTPEAMKAFKSQKRSEALQGNPGQQITGALGGSFNSLKKMAEIKDQRSKFF